MKKSIFTILLFLFVAVANAQFEKGDKYFGGSVGFGFSNSSFNQNNSPSTSSQNNFSVNLNPQFFKAVKSSSILSTLDTSDSINLTNKLNTLILERDDLASRAGSKNPLLLKFEEQIKTIRDRLSNNAKKFKKGYEENSNTLRGFTIGLGFSNSYGSQNQMTNALKNNNIGISTNIGYAIRKYNPLAEKLFWYMEYSATIGYSYSWQKITYSNPNMTIKSDGIGINATIAVLPALAFRVDNRLLIDVNFGGLNTGYNYSSSEGTHSHNYSVQLNLTSRFTLGVLWKLKKSARS